MMGQISLGPVMPLSSQVVYDSSALTEAISFDRRAATCAKGDQDSLSAQHLGCHQHWLPNAEGAAEGALASDRRSGT